jgi:hypothetical protein
MVLSTDSAKQFLLSKITEQALRDGVSLDEIEKKMFVFSESSGNADVDAHEAFDRTYDSSKYESKISKLLRRAYAHDRQTREPKQKWADSLNALSRDDFYGSS